MVYITLCQSTCVHMSWHFIIGDSGVREIDCLCLQVEELQQQIYIKGKDVDTATAALGDALEEVKQLQESSSKARPR